MMRRADYFGTIITHRATSPASLEVVLDAAWIGDPSLRIIHHAIERATHS
jgi:hypothetical protein